MPRIARTAGWGERLRQRAERLAAWFSPPRVELTDEERRALAAVYPRLDLGRVSFHRGIPHIFALSPKDGITLPALWPPGGSRVYMHPKTFGQGRKERLSLVLHEGCHALQIRECGWGLGLAHPFILLYLATAAGNGFRYGGHPLEADAYRVAGNRRSLFENRFHDHDHGGDDCAWHGELVTEASGLAFWQKLARSVPGLRRASPFVLWLAAPLIVLWLLVWSLVTAVSGLAQLVLMTVGRAGAWILAGLGRVAS